jgi:hypothetical protein
MAIYRFLAARMSQQHGSRRNSSSLSVVLYAKFDLEMLQTFLLETIPRYSTDLEFISISLTEYTVLYGKLKDFGNGRGNTNSNLKSFTTYYYQTCREELMNCATVISTFISSVKRLPARTIFQAHFLVGCIQETVLQIKLANHSYLKALWIASAQSTISPESLAVTLHCLGRTYGALGQHNEAINLLRNAEKHYMALSVHKDHNVLVETRKLITFHNQRILEVAILKTRKKSNLWSSAPILGHSHCSSAQLLLIKEEVQTTEASQRAEADLPANYRRPSM